MSLTDRFIGYAEAEENRAALLEYLLDNEAIEHPTSVGIAKQIIGDDGSLKSLSEDQEYVYETYIKPHYDQNCSSRECCGDGKISPDDFVEAIEESDGGELYCFECRQRESYIEYRMDKDD